MRLINAVTLEFQEYMNDQHRPPYAILSHTWGEGEVSHADWMYRRQHVIRTKRGAGKILQACEQARRDGLWWVWADMACIDKTSSAELSEAINAMYAWYRESAVCYVHLADVYIAPEASVAARTSSNGETFVEGQRGLQATASAEEDWHRHFIASRWFTRGWTLQELIAPRSISFFAFGWIDLGSGRDLARLVAKASRIPLLVLQGDHKPTDYSVAQRMSWASRRVTTRVEDLAYCLLGLFEVNMPLLYGEREGAFVRLQEEIMRSSADISILAWDYPRPEFFEPDGYLLAHSPASFSMSAYVRARGPSTIAVTNRGLKLYLPVGRPSAFRGDLLVLNCYDTRYPSFNLALSVSAAPREDPADSATWTVNLPPRLHLVQSATKVAWKQVTITRGQSIQRQYSRQAEFKLNLHLEQDQRLNQQLPSIWLGAVSPPERWDHEALTFNVPMSPYPKLAAVRTEIDGLITLFVGTPPAVSAGIAHSKRIPPWSVVVGVRPSQMNATSSTETCFRDGAIFLGVKKHETAREHLYNTSNGVCNACHWSAIRDYSRRRKCGLIHQRGNTLLFTGFADSTAAVTLDVSSTSEHIWDLTISVRQANDDDQAAHGTCMSRRNYGGFILLALGMPLWLPLVIYAKPSPLSRAFPKLFDDIEHTEHEVNKLSDHSSGPVGLRHQIKAGVEYLFIWSWFLPVQLLVAMCWQCIMLVVECLDPLVKALSRLARYRQYLGARRSEPALRSTALGGWLVEQVQLETLP